MRKHHFTSTKKIIKLQNMMNRKYKVRKNNIPKRNNMYIHRIDIVKYAMMPQKIKNKLPRRRTRQG